MDFLEFNLLDIIDILLVAFLLFQLYKLVRGTVAIKIFSFDDAMDLTSKAPYIEDSTTLDHTLSFRSKDIMPDWLAKYILALFLLILIWFLNDDNDFGELIVTAFFLKDIKEFNLEDRTLITSYDFRILYALKKQNPNVLRGFITLQQGLSITKKNIYENSPWMVKNYPMEELFFLSYIIKSLEGHVWSAFYRDVTKQNVELAHKHGLATCVWTVNREQDIIRMIEYGVDGIITDYPKKVQEICKSKNISWF